jgi:hypothetical protein
MPRLQDLFSDWLDTHTKLGEADVPARLVTVMALLERLQDNPVLSVAEHVANSGMQLKDHNTYVTRALARFGIVSPVKELGRRSSNLHGWIEPLLEWLRSSGFASGPASEQGDMLRLFEAVAAERLQIINQGKPLIARYNKGCTF